MNGISDLLKVVKKLRDPHGGCPWDLEQSHESLLPYFFEEVHEFSDALKSFGATHEKTIEELADVLYQVVLHAQMLEEKGASSFDQISALLCQKLIDRHPHVFDPSFPRYKNAAEVNKAWERIKAYAKKKKQSRGVTESPTPESQECSTPASHQLVSIPRALPSLQRSARIGEKAASFNFDWPTAERVIEKVEEEIKELRAEKASPAKEKEELGDLLFAIAQYARKKGWDPEEVLDKANQKFLARFERMESTLLKEGDSFEASDCEQLEVIWDRIKHQK